MELRNIFAHPNFVDLFRSHLAYLDFLALAKAIYPPSRKKRFVSIRSVVLQRLRECGIEGEAFLNALHESGGVLHGSFLLHCLLTPIGQRSSSYFPAESDIDVLLDADRCKSCKCLSCRKVTSDHREKYHFQCPLIRFRCSRARANISRDESVYMIPSCVQRIGYKYGRDIDIVIIDQLDGLSLTYYLKRHAHFDFGRISYDDHRLFLWKPHALLGRKTMFPDLFSGKRSRLVKEDLERLLLRCDIYRARGLRTVFTTEQLNFLRSQSLTIDGRPKEKQNRVKEGRDVHFSRLADGTD